MLEEDVPGDRNSTFRDFDVSKKEKEYIKVHMPEIIPDIFTNKKPDTDKNK